MRISTAAHPTEYCRSAPPLNAFPRIPVTLGLPCSPENEEVPHGEKDQGQGGPEAEVGERAFAERDRPHRPRLEAQRPGRAGSREGAGRLLGDVGAALGDEPVVDALCGMALLASAAHVVVEPGLDQGPVRVEL